jgi:acetyltransferase
LTNGGGIGVMTTDACEKYGVPMWDDQPTMKSIFSKVTPDFGSTKNPIDITGQARPADYTYALTEARQQKDVGAVIGLYCETAMFEADDLIKMVGENAKSFREAGKPVIFSIVGGAKIEKALMDLRAQNEPVFADTYQASSCLSALYRQKKRMDAPAEKIDEVKVDAAGVEKILEGARKDKRTFLLAHEGQALMTLCGVPMPKSALAKNAGEAAKAADAIGYPVVLKVVSRDILHKSDAGGVALNLQDAEGVKKAFQGILDACKKYKADAVIEGIEVNEMVRPGVEAIIGARRDATFGPIIMCGMGGILVEVLKDVAFRSLPFSREDARAMLAETKLNALLKGARGQSPRDLDMFLDTIIKLGSLICACEGISDIEINPLVVYEEGKGARAVDVRVLLAK